MKKSTAVPVEEVVSRDPILTSKPLPTKKLIAALLGVAIISGGLYFYNRYWIVAKINNRSISRLEYIQAMEKQVGKSTLENMIIETLIMDTANKNNLTIPTETLDQKIKEIEAQLSSQGNNLEETLKAEGMTREDLVTQIKLQQMAEILGQGNIDISEAEIATFISENQEFLPKDKTKQELQELAKTELQQQKKSDNIKAWLASLRSSAQVTTN